MSNLDKRVMTGIGKSHEDNAAILRSHYVQNSRGENAQAYALALLAFASQVGPRILPFDSALEGALTQVESGIGEPEKINGNLSMKLQQLEILAGVADAYLLNQRSLRYYTMINALYAKLKSMDEELL